MGLKKQISRQIVVSEMAPHVHSFKMGENKVDKITAWLSDWIKESLKYGKIKPYDFLPAKSDLAFHIGVSLGTMQNVFRILEDNNLVESKQRIGTYIKNPAESNVIEKPSSKRDEALEIIKKYIIDNSLKTGSILPSSRKLAQITGIPNTTLRQAINSLVDSGIIKKENKNFIILNTKFKINNIKPTTLVKKIANYIKLEIKENLKEGQKLPSNINLAKKYDVSVKTIHDAIKILSKEGVVIIKRGHYGTVAAGDEFVNESYFYEKIEIQIRQYITKNCQTGDKLPSIKEFSNIYKVSPKTIKKALDNLQYDGYIRFLRGRNGGTFVTDIPTKGDGYKWIALDSNYFEN